GLPFEIASVLLLVALVGSVLLARTSKQEAAGDAAEDSTGLTAAAAADVEKETAANVGAGRV
ncbi:MAG: hypothetical protein WCD76_17515, partial [Pyrinomonadaceae bacterium]